MASSKQFGVISAEGDVMAEGLSTRKKALAKAKRCIATGSRTANVMGLWRGRVYLVRELPTKNYMINKKVYL